MESIPIRKVWEREDTHFTPWLSQHLPELQKALDLLSPISEIETEIDAGDFRCDIVGTIGSDKIIIENMFERTDHDHLGKCITNASILKPSYIVWIAETFREEHLSAIDWLNENFRSEANVGFYAVEVSAIQIKDKNGNVSSPAAQFKVLREPDFIIKQEQQEIESKTISTRVQNRKKFWNEFIDAYGKIDSKWKGRTPSSDVWMSTGAGITGVNFNTSFVGKPFVTMNWQSSPSVSLYISTSDTERNQMIFDKMMMKKEIIEQKWDSTSEDKIIWRSPNLGNLTEKHRYRDIRVVADFSVDFNSISKEEWDKCQNWLIKNFKNFEEILSPLIREIK